MRGNDTANDFGGHSMVMGGSGEGRFSGVRSDKMGQKNIVGRYPFHLHLVLYHIYISYHIYRALYHICYVICIIDG